MILRWFGLGGGAYRYRSQGGTLSRFRTNMIVLTIKGEKKEKKDGNGVDYSIVVLWDLYPNRNVCILGSRGIE